MNESKPTSATETPAARKLKIAIVVTAYFIISMGMVFLNKTLLTEGESIPAPLFVTWFQCLVTAGIVAGLGVLGQSAPKDSFYAQFPRFEYDLDTAQKVMPLSIVFVSMIAFNNLCLQYVEVSFYQVARGLTTVFNVVLSYLFLGEITSNRALACCALIIMGFYVGVENEVHFTLIGTVFGITSSFFVCLNALYTKRVYPLVDYNQWKLALYNNINAMLLFPPIIYIMGEDKVLLQHGTMLQSVDYWIKMITAGVFGFLIGIVVVFQITLTSPLTHNVAGTAKATLQTFLALFIYRNPITFKGGMGIALILLGSSLYTYVRSEEMNEASKASKKAAPPVPVVADKDARENTSA